jgi:hypothetical protein
VSTLESKSSMNFDLAIDLLSDIILNFIKKEARVVIRKPFNVRIFRKPSRQSKISRISYFDWREITRIEEAEMFEYLDNELTSEALEIEYSVTMAS